MSNSTQAALAKALMALLEDRPMDKITVIDIARECGVNRNTFYYHFHDISGLLDYVFQREENRISRIAAEDFSCWRDGFHEGTRWFMEHKAAVGNIYGSSYRDRLEEFLINASKASAHRYLSALPDGRAWDFGHIEGVESILAATIIGAIIEWLHSGAHGDPRGLIENATKILEGYVNKGLRQGG